MPPKLAKGMDPLGDISDEEELSDSGEGAAGGAGGDGAEPGPAAPPKRAPEVDFETLQRAGYRRRAHDARVCTRTAAQATLARGACADAAACASAAPQRAFRAVYS
jgi:hypothetical protein